jgi:hypothetical protein
LKNGAIDATSNAMAVSAITKKLYGLRGFDGKTRDLGDLRLLSSDYFFPKNYMTQKTVLTQNTVGIHDFAKESGWWSAAERRGAAVARGARRVLGRRIFGLFEKAVYKHYEKAVFKELRATAATDGGRAQNEATEQRG